MADFPVKFTSIGDFSVRFGSFKTVTKHELNHYEGSYEITPQITAQTLQTAQKTMTNDLTVKEIPYAEVSNIFGGKTITIGG